MHKSGQKSDAQLHHAFVFESQAEKLGIFFFKLLHLNNFPLSGTKKSIKRLSLTVGPDQPKDMQPQGGLQGLKGTSVRKRSLFQFTFVDSGECSGGKASFSEIMLMDFKKKKLLLHLR